MNPHPIDNREALAKLPARTQRFWTWLTGLTHQDELPRKPWTPKRHLAVYALALVMSVGITGWAAQTLYTLGLAALA